MFYHHGFTHPLLVTLAWMYFFSLAAIVSWCLEVEVPHVFLLFVCVFGISLVFLGLPANVCIHVPAFLMTLSLNEKRVKDAIAKKKNVTNLNQINTQIKCSSNQLSRRL
jgi:hypothetical protein